MRKIKFETSKGVVVGIVKGNGCVGLSAEGKETLNNLYDYDSIRLERDWVKIALVDDYYGEPEYKVI